MLQRTGLSVLNPKNLAVTYFFVVVILSVVYNIYAQCPPSNQLCGSQCSNTNTHVCLQPNNHLCPIGHDICGVACFVPSLYTCIDGVLVEGGITESAVIGGCGPLSNQRMCLGECYGPTTHECVETNPTGWYVVCPIGHGACQTACYFPTQYHCINGNLFPGPAESLVTDSGPLATTCEVGEDRCGNQCFITGNHLCDCGARNFCPGDGATIQ